MTKLSDEEREEKAKELDYSALFDVHLWSEHPEVNEAVDELYSMLLGLPDFKGNEQIRKKHVKVVILDLYVKRLTDPLMYSSYHRKKGRYTGLNERYPIRNWAFCIDSISNTISSSYPSPYSFISKDSSSILTIS